ncbi:hypothetical protein [Niastella yeongjuensis]|nr:hypothetical protein [Niastella yeongjuensis]
MNKIKGLFILSIVSCNLSKEGKIYQDFSNKYHVEIKKNDNGVTIDSTYTLFDFNEPSKVNQYGFMKDGFRNGLWSYNMSSTGQVLKWGHYKDSVLNFETNLISEIDSIKNVGVFTKILYRMPDDTIIVSIGVNTPFKDSLAHNNFQTLQKAEFSKMGVAPVYFQTKKVTNGDNEIYYSDVKINIPTTKQIKFITDAYCFLDEDLFVEITLSHIN